MGPSSIYRTFLTSSLNVCLTNETFLHFHFLNRKTHVTEHVAEKNTEFPAYLFQEVNGKEIFSDEQPLVNSYSQIAKLSLRVQSSLFYIVFDTP